MELSVPWLRAGTGKTPRDGGCIMQVIDWIDRNSWTDRPGCVNPVIRILAIGANDELDDTRRQELLDLAPRLMNTNDYSVHLGGRRVLSVRLLLHLFTLVEHSDAAITSKLAKIAAWADDPHGVALPTFSHRYDSLGDAVNALIKFCEDTGSAEGVMFELSGVFGDKLPGSWYYDTLLSVLDEYDRLTGRPQPVEKLDFSEVCAAINGV